MGKREKTFKKLNNVQKYSKKANRIPRARIHANSLFKFMDKLEYLQIIIKNKKIYPRYVIEPVEYLYLRGFNKIAIPMICFCDINLHNLDEHISYYGNYGIALSKNWGKKQNIQPIQYVNKNSELRKDFTKAFNKTFNFQATTKEEELLINYLFHQLMFFKPYESRQQGRVKCFNDECEWRHIAKVSDYGYPQILWGERIMDPDFLRIMSDSFVRVMGLGLAFEYSDIKYIIVEKQEDFDELVQTIQQMNLNDMEKSSLFSKIMIWDDCKEDL